MRDQMGLDPATCDPAIVDELRRKFRGEDGGGGGGGEGGAEMQEEAGEWEEVKVVEKKKKVSKKVKQRKSRDSNVVDRVGGEEEGMRVREEKEIHLHNDRTSKSRTKNDPDSKDDAGNQGPLDFGDLFGEMGLAVGGGEGDGKTKKGKVAHGSDEVNVEKVKK